MADPLSALSGIVTLIGASTTIINDVRSLRRIFRDAEDDYLALSNEINDFNAVLLEARDAYLLSQEGRSHGTSATLRHDPDSFAVEINRAKTLLYELGICVKSMAKRLQDSSETRVNKIAWVKQIKTLEKRRAQLRESRIRIHIMLDVSTASCSGRIENALHTFSTGFFQRHDQTEAKLDQIISSFTRSPMKNRTITEDISELRPENDPILGSTGEDERIVVPDQRSLPDQRGLLLPANAKSENDSSAALLSSLTTWQTSAITWISLELRKCDPCMGVCACVCHIHHKVQTPQILHCLTGNLLVGYAGMSFWKPKCNIPICRGFRAKSVRLNYCFPQWFVARTVHIAWHTCFGGTGLELSVQRRLPEFEGNSVFHLAHAGNCEGVKILLTQRKIMPNDADAGRGCTPLHFAVKASKVETCKILLASGANPNLEMDNGVSAIQLAWAAILRHPENQAVQQFRILFPEWQCLEGLELSELHKTVLGLLHVDLRKMLQRPEIRSQVNYQDTWGKTPLHWAARESDRAKMEALILAGADVELTDCNRETPLFQAVASSSVECVGLLLAVKANVHAVNIHNEQPIDHASQKSVALVELLVQAGASLESNTASKCLDWAAMGNCVGVVQYLLDFGVQRNVPDWAGNTPVFAAITCNTHEVLELLLHEGVDLGHRNRTGGTVLHCVARSGVKRTAEIMLGAELQNLDPLVQDLQGRRAREVLKARIHPPEDLERAFEDLLTRVESDHWYDGMGSDSEEFFDALDMTPIQVDSVEN